MQISLPLSLHKIKFPFLSPFFEPNVQHPQIHLPKKNTLKPQNISILKPIDALRGSGFVSVMDRAIEEEEYRKARAEVNRKGVEIEGVSIEGISIGGHETCIIIPEFKSAFDIGRCPSRAIHQNFLFITHAHLDHIGGLPMYVATRGLYNLKPPTIFVPPCIKEDLEKLFDIHRSLSQVELKVDLIPLDIGRLSNNIKLINV